MIKVKTKDLLYPNFMAEIARKGFTAAAMAQYLGITPNTLSSRVNGISEWRLPEMRAASKLLGKSMDYLFDEVERKE